MPSASKSTHPPTAQCGHSDASACSLCGLLCSSTSSPRLPTQSPAPTRLPTPVQLTAPQPSLAELIETCPRRLSWRSCSLEVVEYDFPDWRQQAQEAAAQLGSSPRSLIWLDACDVATVRAAVSLAQAMAGTVHVGTSTGSQLVHRVMTSEGWLGSTLAEVATHADVIITLGSGIIHELPRLPERFICPAVAQRGARWFHIGDVALPVEYRERVQGIPWPRAQWYQRLTTVLGYLQSPGSAQSLTSAESAWLKAVSEARHIVWLWESDEFCDAIEELTIRRLLGICRQLSQQRHSSLLCMDANPGRVTALETLLWLTGCHGTARYTPAGWSSPAGASECTLERWETQFDQVMLVRSVPSLVPLPHLAATHYLVPGPGLMASMAVPARTTPIAGVGLQAAGHLFRGDRGVTQVCRADWQLSSPAPPSNSAEVQRELPTAAMFLEEMLGHFHGAGGRHGA